MLVNKDNNEINPIVMQLEEFGFDKKYSRRVFHYLHPADLEEALNYMSKIHGIIQHRFIRDSRKKSNKMCYICGEKKEIHLKDLNIGNNINNNEEDQKDIDTIDIMNFSRDISSNDQDIRVYNGNNKQPNINKINKNKKIFKKKKQEKVKKAAIESVCRVCSEKFIPNEKNKVKKCGHAFCPGCWYDYLSVNIKENKISSIKCLDYNCKEKLTDEFILQLLNSDQDLIKLYKRYKLELEIINDPNKKLCPYPNCDSYLEQKNKKNKIVKCKSNHSYCFVCLKKHQENSPCDNTLDKSIEDFTKNHFVKKCPGCGIITEKNNGCNHITCAKCGHQWCWICNGDYGPNHYNEGKCRGFQFFKPKNDNDIKNILQGKLKANELSSSQRQYNIMNEQELEEADYNQINCCTKILYTIIFIFFGNCFFIPKGFNIFDDYFAGIIIIYGIFNIALFFPMILINAITFLFILIFCGFQRFILNFEHLETLYIKKFVIVAVNLFIGFLNFIYFLWEEEIRYFKSSTKKYVMRLFIFLMCIIFLNIAIFPWHLFINILFILLNFIIEEGSFSRCFNSLDNLFNDIYGFSIQSNI